MEESFIVGEFDEDIVQGYSFRSKNLAANYPWKNFVVAKVQGGLSKGNCVKAKLRKAIVLEKVP